MRRSGWRLHPRWRAARRRDVPSTPTNFWTLPLWLALGGSALMVVLWAIQCRTRNAALVDAGWAFLVGAAAVIYAIEGTGADLKRGLAAGLGGLWSTRLVAHLLNDRILGHPEEGRYRALRGYWGARANLHFLWFFVAQAWLAVALALPFRLLAGDPGGALGPLQGIGLAVFALAWIGEAVADAQLQAFRTRPEHRGQTCRRGLWRWSRHPNYFFEWLIWVGMALLAMPAPHGAWAWLAALGMFVLITRVTGIPYAEAQALRSRGDDYRRYQVSTSSFFPLPPRREAQP